MSINELEQVSVVRADQLHVGDILAPERDRVSSVKPVKSDRAYIEVGLVPYGRSRPRIWLLPVWWPLQRLTIAV